VALLLLHGVNDIRRCTKYKP